MDALKRFTPLTNVLVLLSVSSLTYAASDMAVNLDASIGLDDNVTRAQEDADIEHDVFASVGASLVYEAVHFDTGQIAVNLDASATGFDEFSGLSFVAGGGGANYTFSPWAGFGAPWFSLDLQYKVLNFDSFLRDSNLFVATTTFGKRIDDRTDMRTAFMYQSRDSDGRSFDTENTSWFINFDFKLQKKLTLYTTFKYQDGDVFSSTDPNNLTPSALLSLINAAKAIEQDDVFNGKLAYRLDGTVQLYTVGLNLARNLDSAYDLSVRFLTSDADGDLEYEDLTVRLSYFHRFGVEF
jgi:hypothetical protein